MIEPQNSPTYDESQVTNISQTEVNDVHAEMVRMHQADADTITADKVELQQSAAGSVKATRVSAHQSALATVDAGEVLAEQTAMGYVHAEKASVSGYTGVVVAGSADIQHGLVGMVAGRDVYLDEARTVFLLARTVNGNVTTLMDRRSALQPIAAQVTICPISYWELY